MIDPLIDPTDSLERQNEKLRQISAALMRRVEQDTERAGVAYVHFERAAMLEDQVRQRTEDLERTLDLLNRSNAELARASKAAETAHTNMANAIEAVQEGFAHFDSDDRLVMCNSRFGLHLPDIRNRMTPGLHFADYVEMVSRSRYLDLPDGQTPRDWAAERLRLHKEHRAIFNVGLVPDRWLQVNEQRTPDGGKVVLQTEVTDILRYERKERDKLLDTQARTLRATLDHLNQGVCIFDRDRALVGWNERIRDLLAVPVSLLQIGMGFETLLDQLKTDFETDEAGVESFRFWARQGENRSPLRFEIRRPRLTLDVFAQEMPDRGFVVSFTDVSAERESARALAEANELLERRVLERTLELEDALETAERANASKSRFVAAASHDLLQPLSAAKLYMAALADAAATPEQGDNAAKALNALGSVEGIIDALLNISKLDSGAAALDIATIPLSKLLNELRDEFTPAARLKGIDLRVVPTGAFVTSDPGFLRRILQNLIGNAIRYTPSGRVVVGVRNRGGHVRAEVWDTGPGIAEKDQERIFNEFERLGASGSHGEGLGLGLAIVERACAQLGHPLEMTSVVGKGTGFIVTLKRAAGPVRAVVNHPERAERVPLNRADVVVLLVENDSELRRAMTLLIEGWGVQVLEAASGEEALELLGEIEILPDAALLDYHLGDGHDGRETALKLRTLSKGIGLRIISADRSTELQKDCAEAGLTLMSKPVDTGALKAFLLDVAKAKSTLGPEG